ncbi:MAG: hypothetical protein LBV17_09320, partial [Treponema sp.]|nr:hypothetical protein [Treponema sp.]
MPGMYPDDEVVEIFGEKVMYPGLDPETHKFTDGDFSDPLKKPSHIPAATFNLLLDNMENFIRDMGLEPNNTEPNQIKKAIRQGIYTKQEIDDKQNALINMMYKSGYWYGRRYTATPWPVPAAGDTWTANSRKAYDFETNKIWIWNGTQWVADETLPVSNGTTIGVSDKFLDITDNGYPGKAIYSGDKKSWDFYPDKYNEEIIKRAVIMPGLAESCFVSDAAVLSLYRRIPMDGRTISINDSRVERLLRYCLIPHATAISNVDIIGMYLTNEYYEDHAAWLAANKTRPTPAANGVYLVIPDGSGIFLRGANQHGGHKAADGTLYDGGAIGKYQTDKLKRHIHSISAFRATGNFGLPEGGHYY